jgi:hypothetical protein
MSASPLEAPKLTFEIGARRVGFMRGSFVFSVLWIEQRRHKAWQRNRLSLAVLVLICSLTGNAFSQPGKTLLPVPSSSISGTILDANGAVLSGAGLILTASDGTAKRTQLSDSNGEFTFGELTAGTYKLTIA